MSIAQGMTEMNERRMRRLILAVLGLAFVLLAASSQAAVIFSTNATWRLFKGRTEASTPDTTAWRGVNFVDSTFVDAPAPFWYDTTGDSSTLSGGTQLTDMINQYSCIFLRRTFVLTNTTEFSALRFGALIDDGFVVWINGTEVQRVNVGTAGSAVSVSTLATGATEPVPFNFYDLLSPASYLVVGTNVIAIQVFNTTLASSDLDFNCSLGTTAPDLVPPTVADVSPAAGTVNTLGQVTVRFSEPVAGVNASDLLVNGLPASSMTGGNDTYTFTFPQPAYGTVNITWAGGHGITDFGIPPNSFNAGGPGATWQYNLIDNIPPTVAFQLPFAGVTVRSLTQIEVDFTEGVTGVDAADLLIN